MTSISDGIIKTYLPGVGKDQFEKDKVSFRGKFYAVKVDEKIVIKQVFFSFGSFFSFIGDLLFNNKNTFLRTKSINQLVNSLPQPTQRVSDVGSATLQTAPGAQLSFCEIYDNFAVRAIPFIDGWISNLSIVSKAKIDDDFLQFVQSEINGIEAMIARKEHEAKISLFDPFKDDPNHKKELKQLESGFKMVKRALAEVKKHVNESAEAQPIQSSTPSPGQTRIPGIQNAGNSCYMNSALQALLSSPAIVKGIKNYKTNPIPSRESYMPALQKFLKAYERFKTHNDSETSSVIGSCAAELRQAIFTARLKHLDVESLYAMADADLIIMILGDVLKLEYTFVTRMTASEGIDSSGKLVRKQVLSNVESQQLLWPEIKTTGSNNEPTLQDAFKQQCIKASQDTKLDWRAKATDGTALTVDKADKRYRIKGNPPPLIAFKVGNSSGAGRDATFRPYKVSEKDAKIDIIDAFDDTSTPNTQYRLIAVCENHGRIHWTAKAKRGSQWYDCNDNVVTRLGTNVPNANAAVMLYERIT